MRPLASLALPAFLTSIAICQPAGSRATFEAADVHVSPATTRFLRGGMLHGTRYELKGSSMLDMISTAYGIDGDKVLGGPSWIELDRFDVIAKAPAKTPQETLNQMLQSVLADRFKLVIVQENRPLPAYSLTAGKHQGLKEADPKGETGCKLSIEQSGPPPQEASPGVVIRPTLIIVQTCRNMTMEQFVKEIPDFPTQAATFRSRPVTDDTQLKGAWDFTFKYSLGLNGPAAGDNISVFDALEKQLGLKLTQISKSQPVIVVKSVNETPTENPPEVLKAFPPLPTEFDVAEIKPSQPGENGMGTIVMNGQIMVAAKAGGRGGMPTLQNGRLNLQGYTLRNLITVAWNITNDDALVGAPKFVDTERFDVIAKAPGGPAADAFTDLDSIKPLLRALLIDRFKIVTHTEDRPLPGFVLAAVKPKMTKADPTTRTSYTEGPGPDGKDPRIGNPAAGRLVYFQNVTMAQFARLLPNFATAYFRNTTLEDATGLEGSWNFTLNFSAAGLVNGRGGRGGDGAVSDMAAEPSGAISLADALVKQLGLKLETQKRPMPVLVIDHIEQKPTEN